MCRRQAKETEVRTGRTQLQQSIRPLPPGRPLAVVVALIGLSVLPWLPAVAETVTIYRDTYGVPHIYASTPAGAAYGLGYAQAEDRLEDIFRNVHTAIGTMAEHFGPDHVETDYAMRLVGNARHCETYWQTASPEVRELGDSFVRGVEAYLEDHPEKKPEYAIKLEGWHCAAIGRTMLLQWPLGTVMSEFRRRSEQPAFGSNGWAVAPSRSANNCAILLTDPHLTWESLAVFHEARVFGGDLVMNGFFIVGTPALGLGHNANVGWACTTGGPDTSDAYMLRVRKTSLGFEYEYDGAWRTPELKLFTIKVKGEKPRAMPAMFTVHGPLLEEPDFEKGVAYAGNTPYLDDAGFFHQQYAMCMAQDAHEFFEALRLNSFMEQNILFADRKGNIGYARVGRTPIRPEGDWDWSRPVPGDTPATQWLGIHSLDDHVWIMNPPQGYMQNCNISPANMMEHSPLTPEKYLPYLYNCTWDKNNPRGRRALELLAADDAVTVAKAKAIVMDVYDLPSRAWQDALRAAFVAAPDELRDDAVLAAAVADLLAWNCEFTQDSTAAAIMRLWRLSCEGKVDVDAIADGKTLSEADRTALLEQLRETLAEMERLYDGKRVTWGEVQVVGRGGQYFPCDGADFGRGANSTETLRNVEAKETPPGSGRFVANSGSMAAMLMFFHADGIESYTCTPWGQSADPASPHHVDQARDLYSKRLMKPTWFNKDELIEHLESKKVLTIP